MLLLFPCITSKEGGTAEAAPLKKGMDTKIILRVQLRVLPGSDRA